MKMRTYGRSVRYRDSLGLAVVVVVVMVVAVAVAAMRKRQLGTNYGSQGKQVTRAGSERLPRKTTRKTRYKSWLEWTCYCSKWRHKESCLGVKSRVNNHQTRGTIAGQRKMTEIPPATLRAPTTMCKVLIFQFTLTGLRPAQTYIFYSPHAEVVRCAWTDMEERSRRVWRVSC